MIRRVCGLCALVFALVVVGVSGAASAAREHVCTFRNVPECDNVVVYPRPNRATYKAANRYAYRVVSYRGSWNLTWEPPPGYRRNPGTPTYPATCSDPFYPALDRNGPCWAAQHYGSYHASFSAPTSQRAQKLGLGLSIKPVELTTTRHESWTFANADETAFETHTCDDVRTEKHKALVVPMFARGAVRFGDYPPVEYYGCSRERGHEGENDGWPANTKDLGLPLVDDENTQLWGILYAGLYYEYVDVPLKAFRKPSVVVRFGGSVQVRPPNPDPDNISWQYYSDFSWQATLVLKRVKTKRK